MTTLVHLAVADLVRPAARLPVSEDRVAELVESVARVGLLQPLVVVPNRGRYRLVAGRHRLAAVTRLGWETVPCVMPDLDRVREQLVTVDENLIRSHPNFLERAELIARRVDLLATLGHARRGRPRKAAPVAGFPTTMTAHTSGLSPRSVRLACQVVAGLPEVIRDQVRATKAAESSKQLLALARLPADEQREVARLLAIGEHRRVGAATVAARRRLIDAGPGGHTPGVELHLTDFRNLPVPPHSVRLVLTDPPWAADWLAHWPDLAEWAARVLAPGGVFASYVGIQHLPEVLRVAGTRLCYTWTLAGVRPGGCRLIPFNGVMTAWQPVVLFTNGPPAALSMPDVLPRAAKEKSHHVWQQPAAEAEFLIERLTRPGDLVVDGCVGSGTVAVACRRLGRRFIGGDVDPTAVRAARARLCDDRDAEHALGHSSS